MNPAKSGGSLVGRIGSYLQIFAKDPSSTAFIPLAEAYRQIGLLDDALEATRLGTKMLPHFSPGFSTMGRILGQMGRTDEALNAYATALDIDSQSKSALIGLACLHLTRGERDLARKTLKQAEEFHPDDEKIADMLVALDLPTPWSESKQAVQIKEPAPQLETALEEPAEPIPTATLAEIYVKQGLTDKAIKIYQDILIQNPGNKVARERIMHLQQPFDVKTEISANEHVPATSMVASELQNAPVDQSPLTVLKRWLTAIKQGRANV